MQLSPVNRGSGSSTGQLTTRNTDASLERTEYSRIPTGFALFGGQASEMCMLPKRELLPRYSYSQGTRNARVDRANLSFHRATEGINGLFAEIFRCGVSSADLHKVAAYRNRLQKLEAKVERLRLAGGNRAVVARNLANARIALNFLRALCADLPAFQRDEKKLERSCRKLWGNSLTAAPIAADVVNQLSALERNQQTKPHLAPFIRRLRQFTDLTLAEWADELESQVEKECRRLSAWQSLDASVLLASLRWKIASIEPELAHLKSQCEELGLRCSVWSLDRLQRMCKSISQQIVPTQAPGLIYGTGEWRGMMDQCPKLPANWYKRLVKKYGPEQWSDRTKRVVYFCFRLMQLFASGVKIVQQIPDLSESRKIADNLQRQVIANVPEDVAAQIDRDTSTMGVLLVDKYAALADRSTLEVLTKRCPDIRPALTAVVDAHGEQGPRIEEIERAMAHYQLGRLIAASPTASPFTVKSPFQWWDALTTQQTLPEPDVDPIVEAWQWVASLFDTLERWVNMLRVPRPAVNMSNENTTDGLDEPRLHNFRTFNHRGTEITEKVINPLPSH